MVEDKKKLRLQQLFKETGWTQKKLASMCGYTPQYIGDLLNGKKPIQKDCAVPLSKCLGVRIEYLLCYDDYKTERERVLNNMTRLGSQSILFEELLKSLGNKIVREESEDPLNDIITITDTLSFDHKISEKEFDILQKEIFDFIEFKIDRL